MTAAFSRRVAAPTILLVSLLTYMFALSCPISPRDHTTLGGGPEQEAPRATRPTGTDGRQARGGNLGAAYAGFACAGLESPSQRARRRARWPARTTRVTPVAR